MKLLSVIAGVIAAFAASAQTIACGASSSEANADDCRPGVLVAWNERVLLIAEAEDKFLTLKGVRAVAMMHLAMHDAINSIHRHYAAYAFEGDGDGADPVAAAAQAAYEIAVSEYPNEKASLGQGIAGLAWLQAQAGGRSKKRSNSAGNPPQQFSNGARATAGTMKRNIGGIRWRQASMPNSMNIAERPKGSCSAPAGPASNRSHYAVRSSSARRRRRR